MDKRVWIGLALFLLTLAGVVFGTIVGPWVVGPGPSHDLPAPVQTPPKQ